MVLCRPVKFFHTDWINQYFWQYSVYIYIYIYIYSLKFSHFTIRAIAHWVPNLHPKFSHVKKINTTSRCVNHFYTLPPKLLSVIKFFGSGLIFCVSTSVVCLLIGKDDEYEKIEKCMRKFRTQCARTFRMFSIQKYYKTSNYYHCHIRILNCDCFFHELLNKIKVCDNEHSFTYIDRKFKTHGVESRLMLLACVEDADLWLVNVWHGESSITWSTRWPMEEGLTRAPSVVNTELLLSKERNEKHKWSAN